MIRYIEEELDLSPELAKKVDWAKNYNSINLRLEKGALIRLEPTNIAYIKPHKIIINNTTFLLFNETDTFYIENLNNPFKLGELTKQFKNATIDF